MMSKSGRVQTLILAIALTLGGCDNQYTTSQGPVRILGLDISDLTQTGSFYDNLVLAAESGVQAATMHLKWNELEPCSSASSCSPNYIDFRGALVSAEVVYGVNKSLPRLSLTLSPVDTSSIPLPADLPAGRFYDFGAATGDPTGMSCSSRQVVVQRFNSLLDFVFSQIPNVKLVSLQIGNEIDLNTAFTSSNLWNEYAAFFRCARAHAKAKYAALHNNADLPVGVTFSLYGLTDPAKQALLTAYNTALGADLVGVTYYPVDVTFIVKAASVIASDLAALTALYPGLPIYLQEVGFPTSPTLGGSETSQVEFIREIFNAWDRYAAQIPFVSFLRLNDQVPASNGRFDQYLATLGMRTYPGRGLPKLGYCAFKTEAHKRGWAPSACQ